MRGASAIIGTVLVVVRDRPRKSQALCRHDHGSVHVLEAMTTPSDLFETGGKRVFIAHKAAPDPRFGCNMQLITRYSGSGQGADSWGIEQVRYSGGCEYF